jgi:PTH1 family peptidyl-tRNA hydrolase
MATRVLIAGLGNLTHPLTRHRRVFFLCTAVFLLFIPRSSVGQLALDSLATRLGVRLSPDKSIGGYYAETNIEIHGRAFILGLYKTRTYVSCVSRPDTLLTSHISKKRPP